MGSEKYPDENSFDLFIKNYGGSDNASTDCERVSWFSNEKIICQPKVGPDSTFWSLGVKTRPQIRLPIFYSPA